MRIGEERAVIDDINHHAIEKHVGPVAAQGSAIQRKNSHRHSSFPTPGGRTVVDLVDMRQRPHLRPDGRYTARRPGGSYGV
jgi:hypothetical protein